MPLRESINVALSELSRSYIQLRDASTKPATWVAGVLARLTNVSDFSLGLYGVKCGNRMRKQCSIYFMKMICTNSIYFRELLARNADNSACGNL
jgi:hypothetical protein